MTRQLAKSVLTLAAHNHNETKGPRITLGPVIALSTPALRARLSR